MKPIRWGCMTLAAAMTLAAWPAQAERASSLAPTTEVQETGEEQENQEPEEPAPEEGGEPQPAEDGKTGTPEEEPEIVVVEKATAAVMLDALRDKSVAGFAALQSQLLQYVALVQSAAVQTGQYDLAVAKHKDLNALSLTGKAAKEDVDAAKTEADKLAVALAKTRNEQKKLAAKIQKSTGIDLLATKTVDLSDIYWTFSPKKLDRKALKQAALDWALKGEIEAAQASQEGAGQAESGQPEGQGASAGGDALPAELDQERAEALEEQVGELCDDILLGYQEIAVKTQEYKAACERYKTAQQERKTGKLDAAGLQSAKVEKDSAYSELMACIGDYSALAYQLNGLTGGVLSAGLGKFEEQYAAIVAEEE